MKIEVVPYTPLHAYEVINKNVTERGLQLSKLPDYERYAKEWGEGGPAFTLIIDGEVVGCAGVALTAWNRGEAWTLLSTLFYKYKKTSYKSIKIGLEKIIKEYKLRRIQAVVFDGTEEVCGRFLYHLGFEWEGKHKGYGPHGETMHSYGRVI